MARDIEVAVGCSWWGLRLLYYRTGQLLLDSRNTGRRPRGQAPHLAKNRNPIVGLQAAVSLTTGEYQINKHLNHRPDLKPSGSNAQISPMSNLIMNVNSERDCPEF
jgi:hypothetical protein